MYMRTERWIRKSTGTLVKERYSREMPQELFVHEPGQCALWDYPKAWEVPQRPACGHNQMVRFVQLLTNDKAPSDYDIPAQIP